MTKKWPWYLAGVVLIPAMISGCSSGSATSEPRPSVVSTSGRGDCVTYLEFDGRTYWGTSLAALEMTHPVGEGQLASCDDFGGVAAPSSVTELWQIKGIDPSVAVGAPNSNGEQALWIAFIGSASIDEVPSEVRRLIEGG